MMKEYMKIIVIMYFIFQIASSQCTRQRCCLATTCTQSYCTQRNSQTWISTQNFANYGYTQLVMINNECLPCPYNCQSCSSTNNCQTCAQGFYMANNQCFICNYKCNTCVIVNNITKCSACSAGSYLDSLTSSCKNCATGAAQCSSATIITRCNTGYMLTSNSLFCLPCPSNCQSCPSSNSVCISCLSGYYLKSSACLICTLSNCTNCFLVSNNQRCSLCSTGYYLSSGVCIKCQNGCLSCSSSACSICSEGFYLASGVCNLVTTIVSNCNVYSSPSTCSACLSFYYLSNSKCLPCSILCSSCYGIHFGQCTVCSSSATLFNQMCQANKYNSNTQYQLYYAYPSSLNSLSGGAQDCNKYLYKGKSISISLNNLSASKLRIRWRLFSISGSTSYNIGIINTAGNENMTFATQSQQLKSYYLCNQNSSIQYYAGIGAHNFSNIKIFNTLIFNTNNDVSLGFQQLLVIAQMCNPLCIQCSSIACTKCQMSNLYTQDAYCVYTCSNGYYTYINSLNVDTPGSCLQSCPIGTYAYATNLSCIACKSPCLSCTNDNFCLSCVANYFLTPSNTCSQTCPYQYYGQNLTKNCKNCVGRCNQCLDRERCLNCRTGFYYPNNNTCVDSCSSSLGINGLYADLKTLRCQSCSTLCKNCITKNDYCTECNIGSYFYNFTCLNNCPNGYYDHIFVCQSCSYPCQNCALSPTNCSSCVDSYLINNSCINTCPKGYFQNNNGLICQTCKLGCQQCAENANHCTQCSQTYYLYNQDCLLQCLDRFYQNSILRLCISCSGLCYNCLNQTFCESCTSNYLWDGKCVDNTQCPSGYYANTDLLQCQICSSNCKTCQFNSQYCSSCFQNTSNSILQNHQCVSNCSSTYTFPTFMNNINICSSCISPCSKCLNETYCLQCISGYNLMGGNCGTNCLAGYFFNSTAASCILCFENCLICNTISFCQLCKSQFYIYILNSSANQCKATCPSQYYPNSLEGSCQPCLYPCLQCSSRIDCISCQQGSLYQNRCLSYCPDTTYRDKNVNECFSCSNPCLTCFNQPNYCLTCITNYTLYQNNNTCLLNCPAGTYSEIVTQMCLQCSNLCQQCLNSTFCTSCIQNRTYLYSVTNNCINDCPIGYYGDKILAICYACNQKCLTCATSPDNCLSCNQNFYLIRLTFSTFDCLTSCPLMHYAESQYCQKCIFPCNTCSSATFCLTCVVGTYYYSQLKACLLSCPAASYINYQNQICIKCKDPCSSCKSDTYCLSCLNNKFLYNGNCVSSCPASYYSDNTLICQFCSGLCKTCSSKFYCLSCITGYLSNGFCYNSCPSGTYLNLNTSQCITCKNPCIQCLFNANYCTTCVSGLVQYQGNCNNNCPIGTYLFSGSCLQCNFPCTNCSSLDICYECLGGYLLYNGLTCIKDTLFCPNDFYKMDGKYCIPRSSCPVNYYIDQISKTCSSLCSPEKYVMTLNKTCESSCNNYQYVSSNMVCSNFSQPPSSLMYMSVLAFIRSSIVTIDISFNQSYIWINSNKTIYKLTSNSRRLQTSINNNQFQYIVNQNNPTSILLKVVDIPDELSLNLPAYYIVSTATNYPLQNPKITVTLPSYVPYDYTSIYQGYTARQFGQGLSWFIILLSLFFLFKNRISHLYGLWDTAQLLYILVFLQIQYPPTLNEFLVGLNTIFLNVFPSIFTPQEKRTISDKPFYAYSTDNNFIRNAGPSLTIFLIVVIIYLILKIFQFLIKNVQKVSLCMNNWPHLKKFIYQMLLRYRWHYASDIMFLTYLNVFLFAVAQTYNMEKNPNRGFSNSLCIISLVFYLIFPIFVSTKLHKHFPNISKGRHHENIRCFYRGIDKTSKYGVFLIIIKYFRKIVYALTIGVFSSKPMYALPILMFTSIMMALFTFINLPYKKRLTNVVEIINQICISLLFLGIAVINFNNQLNNINLNISISYICTGILIFILLMLVFQIFCRSLFQLQSQENYRKKQQADKLLDLKDLTQSQIRKKAGQFFDFMFPKIRQEFGFGQQSEDEPMNYQQGDSQNSENNEEREKNWGFQQSEKHSQQFRHYENNSQSDKATGPKEKAPQFLIRCVKQIN